MLDTLNHEIIDLVHKKPEAVTHSISTVSSVIMTATIDLSKIPIGNPDEITQHALSRHRTNSTTRER